MKNSAETNSGFSLFSIDEHRLSVGLLVLFLLSVTGYGIWLSIAPFLPKESAIDSGVSRNVIADAHFKSGDWNKAIEFYGEILRDDPENGYAAKRVAFTWESQLRDKWDEYRKVSSTTGSARAGDEILADESRLFKATTNSWNRLLDNARYQREAYERLAEIYCRRAAIHKSKDELDDAVRTLDEMFQKGLFTPYGIARRSGLNPLKSHPEFPRLVKEEDKISNRDASSGQRSYIRRRH